MGPLIENLASAFLLLLVHLGRHLRAWFRRLQRAHGPSGSAGRWQPDRDDAAMRQPQRGEVPGPPGRTRRARHAGDFKPGLRTVARHEALLGETVSCMLNRLAGCRQMRRPARSFPQAARPMEAPQDTASRNLSLQRARSGSKRQNPPLHLERTGSSR